MTPIVRHGAGQFTGEVDQLSSGVAPVGADADDDVEVLLFPPHRSRARIVAEAELGELQSADMLRLENFSVATVSPIMLSIHHRTPLRRDRRRCLGGGARPRALLSVTPHRSIYRTSAYDAGCVKSRTLTKCKERYCSDEQSQPHGQHD
jgi:hypothetical protein